MLAVLSRRGLVSLVIALVTLLAVAVAPAVAASPPVANDDSYLVGVDGALAVPDDHAFDLAWGSYGTGDGQFHYPHGIAVDSAGDVHVTDTLSDRVQKFDADGTYVTEWGSHGSGDGQFFNPLGMAADVGGNVYVADTFNDRVQKFDADGTYLTQWGSAGAGEGEFSSPWAVAVDAVGQIYVADEFNDRVQKLDAGGTYMTQWGGTGSGNGEFSSPWGVAVDTAGNVYVTDYDNDRVQRFTAGGTYVTQWGGTGSGDGEFDGPAGVAVDQVGTVYVVDGDNNRIEKFTADGTYLGEWGAAGSGDGQFSSPFGVAIDGAGDIYIVDSGNQRVQRFTPAGVLGNDYDVDADPLTAVLDTDVSHGTLSLSADGSFTYVPDSGYSGVDSFTYHATDGSNDSTAATVTITVSGESGSVPVAVDDTYEVAEGDVLSPLKEDGVLINDLNPGGGSLSAVLDTDVSHGVLSLHADGSFTYTPSAGYNGSDSFTYHATDGTNNSNTATVTITVRATSTPRFDDVPSGHTFYADIEWLADEGITKGCNPPANSLFCPNESVTRGQMAAFLHRALGGTLTPGPLPGFVDDAGSVFEADIEWLGAVGVTKGCNPPVNDMFCPTGVVTRGQMAAFLVRALGYTAGAESDRFTDDDGSIFEADIERLAEAGVTKGCNPPTNDRFCPTDPVTRAQMAAFLHRALG